MGLGVRVFFIEDDDSLRRIPLKWLEDLIAGRAKSKSLPEYAGRRMRCAMVIIESHNRKPARIVQIDCMFLKFDSKGHVDQTDWDAKTSVSVEMLDALFLPLTESSVADLRSHFLTKKINNQLRWQPTKEITEAIKKAIFPTPKPRLRLV